MVNQRRKVAIRPLSENLVCVNGVHQRIVQWQPQTPSNAFLNALGVEVRKISMRSWFDWEVEAAVCIACYGSRVLKQIITQCVRYKDVHQKDRRQKMFTHLFLGSAAGSKGCAPDGD